MDFREAAEAVAQAFAAAGGVITDWSAHLRLAAVRLHIPPAAFWGLSVKEWAALTAAPARADGLGRWELNALMAAHPDN